MRSSVAAPGFLIAIALTAIACTAAPAERTFTLQGQILSVADDHRQATIKHETIAGFMEAMTMDFPVRGADVKALPPDGSRIEARLHVTDRAYWITDVKQRP